MYRNGDFVDLCRGPHVPYSTMIQAFNSIRTSSTNWLGKVRRGLAGRLAELRGDDDVNYLCCISCLWGGGRGDSSNYLEKGKLNLSVSSERGLGRVSDSMVLALPAMSCLFCFSCGGEGGTRTMY